MMFTSGSSSHRSLARLAAAASLALAAFSLAACSSDTTDGGDDSSSASGSIVQGGTFTAAIGQPVTNFDPHTANPEIYVWGAYDPLIYLGADGEMVPDLATEWQYLDDSNQQFEVTLREGVTFSDGDALDADAVKASLDRFLSLTTNTDLVYAGPVESIEVTGDYTIVINYSEPFPTAPLSLTQDNNFGLIISPTGLADTDLLLTETHGAGPYVLDTDATVADSSYTFTARDDYWNPDVVNFDSFVLTTVLDPSAQMASLQNGQIDLALNASSVNASSAEDDGFQVAEAGPGVWYLILQDRDSEPLSDPKVREAISLALDRDAVSDAVTSGIGKPASSIAPEGTKGAYGAEEITRDVDKAKELLADAGYPDGFTLSVLDVGALDVNGVFGSAISDQLAEVGITVQLEVATGGFDVFVGQLFSGQFQTTAFPLTFIDLYYTLANDILAPTGIANTKNSQDAQATEKLKAAAVASEEDSEAAYQDAAEYVDSLNWNIPVYSVGNLNIVAPNVANVPTAEQGHQVTLNPFGPTTDYAWGFTE